MVFWRLAWYMVLKMIGMVYAMLVSNHIINYQNIFYKII